MKSEYMKPEQYAKLFVFMSYENTLAVRVSLETGLRIGDVLKMKPDDLNKRTLTFEADKTGKRGRAVISQDLANRLRQVSGTEYIFPKRGGAEGHRTRQTVWRDVKRAAAALRAAGVIGGENISPHSARKTFAVHDMEKYGLEHTRRALQHRDKATTKAYAFSDRYITDDKVGIVLAQILAIVNQIMDVLGKSGKIENNLDTK